eukprot:1594187-Rhodomonas_salina.3
MANNTHPDQIRSSDWHWKPEDSTGPLVITSVFPRYTSSSWPRDPVCVRPGLRTARAQADTALAPPLSNGR